MLKTDITATGKDGRILRRLSIDIENANHLPLADYLVRELDADGHIRLELLLTQYPRWSEPAPALVARAIAALLTTHVADEVVEGVARIRGETLCVTPGAKPRLVLGWLLRDSGMSTALFETWDDCSISDSMPIPTRIGGKRYLRECVLEGQCLAAWAERQVRPWPLPLQVPIRKRDATEYIRSLDIPDHARHIFVDRMRHVSRPTISGETDCYHARDWSAFLHDSQ